MNVLAILTAMALPAVDYGYQPSQDGKGIDYIVQIEPDLVAQLEQGQPLATAIPDNLPPVRNIIITVGNQRLPKILPQNQGNPPIIQVPKNNDAFLNGNIGNPINNGNIGDQQQGSVAPPKLAPPTEWKTLTAAQQHEAELKRQQEILPSPPSFDDPAARPGAPLGGDVEPQPAAVQPPAQQPPVFNIPPVAPGNNNQGDFVIPQPGKGGLDFSAPMNDLKNRAGDAFNNFKDGINKSADDIQDQWQGVGGNPDLHPIPAGGNSIPDNNRSAGSFGANDKIAGTGFSTPKFNGGSSLDPLPENMPPPQIRGQDEAAETDKPWHMLTITALLLFASLGLNGYLFLVARSIYQRYRDLAADMRGLAY